MNFDLIIIGSRIWSFIKYRAKTKFYVGQVYSLKKKSKKLRRHGIGHNYDYYFNSNQELVHKN